MPLANFGRTRESDGQNLQCSVLLKGRTYKACGLEGISSCATQTDTNRPFSSVVIENASDTTSSEATQSNTGPSAETQIWPKYASDLHLRGRSVVTETVRVGYIRAQSAVSR
jgi:hypothetical protein